VKLQKQRAGVEGPKPTAEIDGVRLCAYWQTPRPAPLWGCNFERGDTMANTPKPAQDKEPTQSEVVTEVRTVTGGILGKALFAKMQDKGGYAPTAVARAVQKSLDSGVLQIGAGMRIYPADQANASAVE